LAIWASQASISCSGWGTGRALWPIRAANDLLNLIGALIILTQGRSGARSGRSAWRRSPRAAPPSDQFHLSKLDAAADLFGCRKHSSCGCPSGIFRAAAQETALAAVGSARRPDAGELSGGQQQRIAIARALALQSRLILADEPSNGVDTATTRRILALFRGIAAAEDTTFLIVSHDPMVVEFVDTVYDLHDGRVIKRTTSSETSTEGEACLEQPEN
jgi:hypothetical protein